MKYQKHKILTSSSDD